MTTTYYCQDSDVSDFLQVDAFTGSTTPNGDAVDEAIQNNEKFIDEYTDHAWNSNRYGTVTKEPLVVQHVSTTTVSYRGVMSLDHYPIASLTNLYVWNGGTYKDYVADSSFTAGSFTDPLSGDYWIDLDNGKIYLKQFPAFNMMTAPTGVKAYATYTYGDATTPHDIKKACILLTAADVCSMWDNSDAGTINSRELKEQAMEILDIRSRQGRTIPIAKQQHKGGLGQW
jgi:hypothetical protein